MRNTQLVILFLFCAYLEVRGITSWGDTCPSPGYPGPAANQYSPQITPSQIKCFVLTLNNVYAELTSTSSWLDLGCNDKAAVIYHGARENSTKPWVPALQKVYVSKYNTCAVACDFTAAALTPYFFLLFRTDDKVIGTTTADLIYKVIVTGGGVNLETGLTLVGFSWGAQIAGLAAQRLKELSQKVVGLIVGLDPATGYEFSLPPNRLDPEDAACVLTYHTSTLLGTKLYIFGKKAVFWGQCGNNQYPVCHGDTTCDHVTSHDYFIDALLNPANYVAYSCTQCPYWFPTTPSAISNVLTNYCKSTTVSVLAEPGPCVKEDVYILPTGCVPPNK